MKLQHIPEQFRSLAFYSLMGLGTVGVSLGIPAAPALAASATAQFGVTAAVNSLCRLEATALHFGTYVNVDHTGQSTVTAHCTEGTAFHIGLDQGTGAGATTAIRKMTRSGGSETLEYHLFRDSGRTLNWGNDLAGNTDTEAGTGAAGGAPVPFNVYGIVYGGQGPVPGNYSDTITATIEY